MIRFDSWFKQKTFDSDFWFDSRFKSESFTSLSMGDLGGQADFRKVSPLPCEQFDGIFIVLTALGGPENAVQNLTSWPLLTSRDQTAGSDNWQLTPNALHCALLVHHRISSDFFLGYFEVSRIWSVLIDIKNSILLVLRRWRQDYFTNMKASYWNIFPLCWNMTQSKFGSNCCLQFQRNTDNCCRLLFIHCVHEWDVPASVVIDPARLV